MVTNFFASTSGPGLDVPDSVGAHRCSHQRPSNTILRNELPDSTTQPHPNSGMPLHNHGYNPIECQLSGPSNIGPYVSFNYDNPLNLQVVTSQPASVIQPTPSNGQSSYSSGQNSVPFHHRIPAYYPSAAPPPAHENPRNDTHNHIAGCPFRRSANAADSRSRMEGPDILGMRYYRCPSHQRRLWFEQNRNREIARRSMDPR